MGFKMHLAEHLEACKTHIANCERFKGHLKPCQQDSESWKRDVEDAIASCFVMSYFGVIVAIVLYLSGCMTAAKGLAVFSVGLLGMGMTLYKVRKQVLSASRRSLGSKVQVKMLL
jgi:hypothetical protein